MKQYEVFLIDADDTLFDYSKAEANALETMFNLCGFAYSDNVRTIYRQINSNLWTAFEKGEIKIENLMISRFSHLFEEIGIDSDAIDFNKRYLMELGKGVYLIDGAFDICKYIYDSQIKIYIVTNGISITQKLRINNSSIKPFISGLFVSEELGFQKPQREYFDHIFKKINQVDKNKVLIIGDSLSSDIKGGFDFGIDSCWFNSMKTINQTDVTPTYEIEKLSDIHKMI